MSVKPLSHIGRSFVMEWLVGVSCGLWSLVSPGWWVGAWFDWWCICLQGGLASFVLKIVSPWFHCVLVSVYELGVGMEGESDA